MSNYVNGGNKINVTEVGGAWTQGSGYIEQSGVNKFLYAGENIPAGDFNIKAKLSLAELNGTAASFDLAGNRFGFDGNSNRFFTEGVDWGSPQFHGNASDHITPGQTFDLDVVRNGAHISFSINGTTIVTRTLNSGSLANVGFRPWRNTMRLYDFGKIIPSVNYINAGNKVNVTEIGGAWTQGSGYIEQSGVNKFLYAGETIPAGDFTIKAKLSLAELNGTAASFDLAGNRFGFDGNSNRFFTEGNDWGSPRFHGNASDHITPGHIFDLDVVRNGADLSFKINGTTIVTRTLNSGSLANVGFRPWRNTMRLYDFERTGDLVTEPFFSETVVFDSGTEGYAIFRIPAIIRAGNGDLLAFAEGRVTGGADFGNVDIVMRRSTDNGATWGPLAVIVDNGGLQAGNPGVVVDTQDNNKIVLVYNMGNASEKDIVSPPEEDLEKFAREVFVRTSIDNGYTWTTPVDITTSVHKPKASKYNPAYNFPEDWRWHAVLPGHAIQLSNGRLIFGANYRTADDKSRSFAFYSDDHGNTWQIGGIAGEPGNESTLVQLNNGNVMMNSREFKTFLRFVRYISISTDNGATFTSLTPDNNLPDPRVEGSIIRFTTNPSRILFSNPAHSSERINMTVRVSYDEGTSWTYHRTVNPGSSAYSDLVIESDNKTIGLLYESDLYGFIRYARFNIEWLTNSQDSLD